MFKKRLIEPELLDHLSPEEARPNLADLVRINRKLGGHSVLKKTAFRAIAHPQQTFSLLDVGAASGDSARVLQDLYPAALITSLDYNCTNLERAPYPKLQGDAFSLPFESQSFDYVLCSLFLHHFADEQIVQLIRSFYRLSRRALLICDLERHILPYLFLAVTKPLFNWNRITVHDGLRSVRAALRAEELRKLAREAGVEEPEIRVYRPAFRLSLVATH